MRKKMKQFLRKSLCGVLCTAMLFSGVSVPELSAYAVESGQTDEDAVEEKSSIEEVASTELTEEQSTTSKDEDETTEEESKLKEIQTEDVQSEEGKESTEETVEKNTSDKEDMIFSEDEENSEKEEEGTEEINRAEEDLADKRSGVENLLTNPGFEDNNVAPWVVTRSASAGADAAVSGSTSNNQHDGNYSLHFWSNDVVGFTVEQTVNNLPAGTYKFGGYIIGEDKADGSKVQLAYVEVYNSANELQGERRTATCSIPNWDAGWQNPEIKGIEITDGDYLVVGMEVETAAGGAWGDVDDFYLCVDETEEEPTEYNTTVSLNFYYGDLDANAAEELGFYKWGNGITEFGENNTRITTWGGWGNATENPVYKMTPVDGHSGWFNVTYTVAETITLDENSQPNGSKSGFSIFTSKDSGAAEVVSDCSGYGDPKKHPEIYVGLLKGTITAIRINEDGELVGYATIEEADEAMKSEQPEEPEEDKVWTFDELTALIEEAEICNEEDYTAASWKAFATALDEAKKITSESSEADITAAYEKLGIYKNTLVAGSISVAKIVLSDDFITGADLSSYYSLRESGVVFKDEEGNELSDAGFFNYLKEGGTNWVRIRVWNDPFDNDKNGYGGGNNDINVAKEIGKLATDAGMKVLIDFHYSDFWADPGKQKVPKAWSEYTLDEKVEAVETYTKESLQALKDAGVDVGMVQVGNETTNKICDVTLSNWSESSQIFNAGSKGVRAVYPDALVAIHFTNPERGTYGGFAKNLADNNVDYDVFASSYYPFWHGTLENLTTQLASVAKTYNKKVMVAETSWATTLANQDGHDNTVRKGSNDSNTDYGYSVQGQADEIRSVIKAVNDVNETASGMGIGVFYWEPAWISKNYVYKANGSVNQELLDENKSLWEEHGSGWAASYAADYDPDDAGKWYGGSAIDNQAWFDFFGNALPTAKVYSYIRSGETAKEMAITGVKNPSDTIEMGDTLVYPEKVTVSFNDSSTVEYAVSWNAADKKNVDTEKAGEYIVNGTVTCEYKLNNGSTKTEVRDVTFTITVKQPVGENLLSNPGFEAGTTTPWEITVKDGFSYTPKTSSAQGDNRHGGKWSLHFWNEDAVGFIVSQEVKNLEEGTYTFGGYILGEDKTGGEKEQFAYVEIYSSDGTKKDTKKVSCSIPNYDAGWINPEITGIEVSEGDYLVVGMDVEAASGGAWGDIDDFYLYGMYNITVDPDIEEGTGSVNVSRSRFVAGKKIDITVKPDEGYTLDKLTISGKGIQAETDSSKMILQSENGTVTQEDGLLTLEYPKNTTTENKETFTMPNGSVTVSAVFTEIPGTANADKLKELIVECEKEKQENYTKSSWDIFVTALKGAVEVAENANVSQAQINSAKNRLEEAYEKLVCISGLYDLINQYKDITQGEYTEESWNKFCTALEAAETIIAKEDASQDDIDEAKNALETAYKGLETSESVDLTSLINLIELCEKLNQESYTEASWSIFFAALETAKNVVNNNNSTQEEVDSAKENLQKAYDELKPITATELDFSELNKLISAYENLHKEDYITETWTPFEEALNAAKELTKNSNVTQEEINSAQESLKAAFDRLKFTTAAELDNLISTCENLTEEDYTKESWIKLTEALEAAKEVRANEEATKDQLNSAKENLKAAFDGLKPATTKPDFTELDNLISICESLDQTKYTEESWNALAEALQAAKDVKDKADVTQDEISNAKVQLQTAYDALEELPTTGADFTELNKFIAECEILKAEDYTETSWKTFSETLKAAKEVSANTQATQETVDEAYKNLKTAKDNLENIPVISTDFTELNKLIAAYGNLNEEDYTEETWTVFAEALKTAREIAGKIDATQAEVDSAKDALQAAFDGLAVPKPPVIRQGLWAEEIEDIVYSGKALKPEVKVYDGETLLSLNKDYTVSYKNNTNAGEATVLIKGKGNYADSVEAKFNILPKRLDEADISISCPAVAAPKNNKAVTPKPVVTRDGVKLKSGKDYIVVAQDGGYREPGIHEIEVKAVEDGNYTGSKKLDFIVASADQILMSKVTIKKIPNQKYSDKIEPELTVTYKGETLTEGEKFDYIVKYDNNTNAGQTATVTITGTGVKYVGEKTATFKITGTALKAKDVVLEGASNLVYTGEEQRPAVQINGLTEGVDYTVTYQNNKNAGTATVLVKGQKGYTGTVKKTFKIAAFNIQQNADNKFQYASGIKVPFVKGGSKLTDADLNAAFNGNRLVQGTDYTLTYRNNKKAETTANVTIKGKGNYTGTVSTTFEVGKQDIGNIAISAPDVLEKNAKKYNKIKLVVTDLDGKALKKGTDYDNNISYTLNDGSEITETPAVGTEIYVTIQGKGNYEGKATATFRIIANNKTLAKAVIKVSEQYYTGKEVEPHGTEDKPEDRAVKVSLKVKENGRTVTYDLKEGVDYEIIGYAKNINKGTAKLTIHGIGEYGGTKTGSFKIKQQPMKWYETTNNMLLQLKELLD